MKTRGKAKDALKVALISMPWQDPFSPSIQLGSLSAWLAQERPAVTVDTFNFFLELAGEIGLHLSKRISISWIGEALFAYLLFPPMRGAINEFLEKSRIDDPSFANLDYIQTIETLRAGLQRRLDAIDWPRYAIVGLSVVFAQTFSSLLVAREIKRRAPHVDIVLGGPGVTGRIGKSLLETFDFLDYIANGEGERPLVALIDAIAAAAPGERVDVKGVFHRRSANLATSQVDQLGSLAGLPVPDYYSYFERLAEIPGGGEARGRVRVPIETNRGCWWDLSLKNPMQSCSFCNLNLQWNGYRERPVDQSVRIFAELSQRHQCTDFTVVDNILRHHHADEFITGLQDLDIGLDLWMEARASVRPDQIAGLRKAGARVIQFGIEALSSSMLKKMVKGTTAMMNLQAMKLCEQYQIQNTANLIIDFPGMDEKDIADELENISFARSFYPLSTTEFSLVYQSPAYKAPHRFGIENIRNYEMYRLLMPGVFYEKVFLTEQSFDSAELERLRPLWRQVKAAVRDWQSHYERMKPMVEGNLLLSIQDGGTYLKVRDFRALQAKFYWMTGAERDVYLECATAISRRDLYKRFPTLGKGMIDSWIADWRDKRLAFVDGVKVLGLAIPWGPVSRHRTVNPIRNEAKPAQTHPLAGLVDAVQASAGAEDAAHA